MTGSSKPAGAAQRWAQLDARVRRRDQRALALEDALFDGRFAGYFLHRLRFFVVSEFLALSFHLVELAVLFFTVEQFAFFRIVVIQVVLGLAQAGWWGGLEVLRQAVRDDVERAQPVRAAFRLGRWLAGAGVTAVAAIAVALSLPFSLGIDGAGGLATLYIACALARFAVYVVTSTYHAGVFAVRRVYRPLGAVVLVPATAFALLGALWWVWGPNALPVAGLGSVVVGGAVTAWFAARAYRDLRHAPRGVFGAMGHARRRGRPSPRGTSGRRAAARRRSMLGSPRAWRRVGRFVSAAAASCAMRLGSLLAVALIGAGEGGPQSAALLILAALTWPLMDAAVGWSRLFYFDLARLQTRATLPYARQLAWRVRLAGLVVGLAAGGIAWGLLWLLVPGLAGQVATFIGPLFVLRALVAAEQLIAFCKGAYLGSVLVATALVTVVEGARRIAPDDGRALWLSLALVVTTALLLSLRGRVHEGLTGSIPAAVADVTAHPGERWAILLTLRDIKARGGVYPLVRRLVFNVRRHAQLHLAGFDGRHLVLVLNAPPGPKVLPGLLKRSAGLADVCEVLVKPTGRALVEAMLREDARPSFRNLAELHAAMAGQPQVRLLAAGEVLPERWRNRLIPVERRGLLRNALRQLHGRSVRTALRVEVLPIAPAGTLAGLLLVDCRLPSRRRRRWRADIRALNLLTSVAPPPRTSARHRGDAT